VCRYTMMINERLHEAHGHHKYRCTHTTYFETEVLTQIGSAVYGFFVLEMKSQPF